ncbi:MAG: trypsin-like peptidase domain-containing protein [Rhizobium sp.]
MAQKSKPKLFMCLAFFGALAAVGGAYTQGLSLVRFGLPRPPGMDPQTVCGPSNDLQDVETYDGSLGVSKDYVAANLGSTVQLHWQIDRAIRKAGYSPGTVSGRAWCTGTLIAPTMVLTAGHCFEPQDGTGDFTTPYTRDEQRRAVLARDGELAKLQYIRVGYQVNAATGAERIPRDFPIERLVERKFDGTGVNGASIDYAIVEVAAGQDGKVPGDIVPPAKIATHAVASGDKLVIIQHPSGLPKKIGTGTATNRAEPFIFYDNIDTLGASSGAGVRDENGDIVGVHIRGDCDRTGNSAVSIVSIEGVSDAL